MYCNACGKTIGEESRYCSHCGNVVGAIPVPKKLMRSRTNRTVAGVCAGLAHYLDWDVSLVRILWFLLGVVSGIFPGVLAYVLCWIIMPQEPAYLPAAASQQTAG